MSTFSEDLDFFDQSLFDPLVQFQNKSTSNVTLHSKEVSAAEETPTEEDEEEEEEEVEGEGRWREEEKKGESEKGNQTPDSFTTSLWSESHSTHERTVDSWDLPLGPIPWDDNDKPIERLLSYADLTLTEEEENGLLTDRIIAACNSYLTRSPGNKCHVVAKVSLTNKNINDIRILGYHRFLQYVDLSWNNLTDLTPLGCLPYLMYLDVSHNLLEEVLRFRPPLNLTYVNYSYNEVWQIDDLTDFWALCYLDLSHNKISKIQGLIDLRYLRHLDLSHNKIERFENLNGLRITDLNLECNLISKFEMELDLGMKTLPQLTNVYLNNNIITSLEFLEGVRSLKKLELQGNNISDLVELSHLKLLKHLRHLDLSGNPVSELKPYRSLLLNLLQELKFLDQTEVDISERVAACKRQRFDVQLEAARNNARMILLDQLNDTSLDLDVLPLDQGPYPFVILVGPSASSKKQIVGLLGEKYPDKIYVGKLHTTREVLDSEEKILVHMPREDFNERIKEGKFLCVTENLGELYGFGREQLALAVKEHKLCLTSMDMVAALTIHSYGIQPFLVLAIPQSKEIHTQRLKKTYGPVFASLGAAYIAQRQLINTHASNEQRVKSILDDIFSEVMQKVADQSSVCVDSFDHRSSDGDGSKTLTDGRSSQLSSVRKSHFSGPVFPGKHDSLQYYSSGQTASEAQETFTESEGKAEVVCYCTPRGCFACTSSQCGYQTKLLLVGEQEPSPPKRFSASEANLKSEETNTSYSATQPPLMKVFMSSGEGSFLGEENEFLNWSLPFIDWNEVHLTSLQLEEAAEVLCNKYIENVMSTTDVYQNLHLENPGLFSLSVYVDDINKAVKDITKFLKEVWRSTPKRQANFDVENDLVYKAIVPRKLEKLKEMLRNDFLSADGDGTLKGFNNAAPINSPASICAEMHLKGYGDIIENL